MTVSFGNLHKTEIFIQMYPKTIDEKRGFLIYEKHSDGFIRAYATTDFNEIRLPGTIKENK